MAAKKKGHVVRISDRAFASLRDIWPDSLREAVDLTIQENIDLKTRLDLIERTSVKYVLPSQVHDSLPKAKGAALVNAAKGKKEENPLAVREVV